MYLRLISDESGELGALLWQLHSAAQGARAKLHATFGRLGSAASLPMLLKFFPTLAATAISYACKTGDHSVTAA